MLSVWVWLEAGAGLAALDVAGWWARIQPMVDRRDLAGALGLLDAAVGEHPREEGFHAMRLWACREAGDFGRADRCLAEARQLVGATEAVQTEAAWLEYARAWMHWNAGRLAEGTAAMELAWGLRPREFWIALGLAQSRIRNGRPAEAVALLEGPEARVPPAGDAAQALQWRITLGWAYADRANQALASGDTASYVAWSARTGELAGDTDWGLNQHAASRSAARDWATGERLFLEGMKRFPAYPHFRTNLQALYEAWAGAVPERATELRRKLYDLGPEPRPDWVIQVWSRQLVLDGQPAAAVEVLRPAVRRPGHAASLDETLAWALGELASREAAAGRADRALDLWTEGRTLAGRLWWTWSNEAWGYWQLARDKGDDPAFGRQLADFLPLLWERCLQETPGSGRTGLFRPLLELVQLSRDQGVLERVTAHVLALDPPDDRLLQYTGAAMAFVNNAQARPDPAVKMKAISLVRRARQLHDARVAGAAGPSGIADGGSGKGTAAGPASLRLVFPLRGRVMVVAGWGDPEAATHNGDLLHSYDFVQVDATGSAFRPGIDSATARRNEDWLAFGQAVRAAAGGTVTVADDGQPDRPPGLPGYHGNGVTIRTAGGLDVVYGHLKNGSIRVRPGQTVAAGQVIGALGSSGYSFAPHLHFMVLDQEGISVPYVFTGLADDADGLLDRLQVLVVPGKP